MFSRWQPLWCTAAAVLCLCLPLSAEGQKTAGPPADATMAGQVLRTLLSTPLGKDAPPAPYQATMVRGAAVNAYSNPAGQLQVTSAMLPVLADEPGAWAAVLSHEIGHLVIRKDYRAYLPAFRAEVRKAYLQSPAAQQDSTAGEAVLSAPVGRGHAHFGLSDETEYEADRVGLLIMAEAGYHPDFAIAVHRRMGRLLHENSWERREKQLMKAYDVALAIFQARWPDPSKSPGGNPPPIGNFGPITATPDTKDHSVTLHFPLRLRNANGLEVRVAATFQDGNTRVQSALPEYRSPDGTLELNAMLPGAPQMSTEVKLLLPTAAVAGRHRKLRAFLYLQVGSQQLDISKYIRVNLPEP